METSTAGAEVPVRPHRGKLHTRPASRDDAAAPHAFVRNKPASRGQNLAVSGVERTQHLSANGSGGEGAFAVPRTRPLLLPPRSREEDGVPPPPVPRLPGFPAPVAAQGPNSPFAPTPHPRPEPRAMPPSTAASHVPPAGLRAGLKERFRAAVPLAIRQRMAVLVGRSGLPGAAWWSTELVRDLAERDLNAYHRFLWSHHLAYAATYEPATRFGAEHVHPTRRLLFAELAEVLEARGMDPRRDVRSVLEVGCSLGYLLRHAETEHFPAARVLHGMDIDAYAVARGEERLREEGSQVRLAVGDAAALGGTFRHPAYDVVLCAGVLMYLREHDAAEAVRAMLSRTNGVLALAGLAHPEMDNARLPASVPRTADRSLIHNLDGMVERAGGRVLRRRWDGARQVDGNTIYFVFAAPAGRTA